MAAPNIISLTSITGKTTVANVTNVSTNAVVNLAGSGQAYKINTVLISNVDGVNSADATVSLFRSGAENPIANAITVPAKATLAAISRDTQIYLEEGDALRVKGSANLDLWATISYEILA